MSSFINFICERSPREGPLTSVQQWIRLLHLVVSLLPIKMEQVDANWKSVKHVVSKVTDR